jgi:two-component system, cell cycle sensor histidine kinase and response regulator CckA
VTFRQSSAPAKPPTILIVDDEATVLRFVERVLQDAGYQTATASGGAEAIEAAARLGSFELLVTDVMMPQMNGDELARRLRLKEPDLKILYLTGFSDRLFKEKVTLWENEAFLEKPCTLKSLKEAVSLLLSGHVDRTPGGAGAAGGAGG